MSPGLFKINENSIQLHPNSVILLQQILFFLFSSALYYVLQKQPSVRFVFTETHSEKFRPEGLLSLNANIFFWTLDWSMSQSRNN